MEVHKRGKEPGEPPASSKYRMIDGYKFTYRIGELGDVQKQLPDGSWHTLCIYTEPRNRRQYVRLVEKEGKHHHVAIARLMDTYFFNGYAKKHGLLISYKNGLHTDCSVYNLEFKTRKEINKEFCSHKKRVAKLDLDGNILETYDSVTKAAQKNFISRTAACRRVNKEISTETIKLDGFVLKYVEDLED